MRRVLLILFTPMVILLLLWLAIDFAILPAVSRWAKARIEALDEDPSIPVSVKIGDLQLRLFRPSAVIQDLEITPRGELTQTLGPIKIRRTTARLDLFEIVLGRLQVGSIAVAGLETSVDLDPILQSKAAPKPWPLDSVFSMIARAPIRRVILRNSKFHLTAKQQDLEILIEAREARLSNLGTHLRLDTHLPRIVVQQGSGRLELGALGAAELTPQELRLENLRLSSGALQIRAEGRAEDPANLPVKPRLRLNASTDVPLAALGAAIAAFRPDIKLPALAGNLAAETEIRLEGSANFDSVLRITTTAVDIGPFKIGDAKLEGRLTPAALHVSRIDLKHPAGEARLSDSRLTFSAPYGFRTTADIKSLELQDLFRSLNLHEIPVEIGLRGSLPCEGELTPLRLKCQVTAAGDRLVVRSENKASAQTIVALKDLGAEGEVELDKEQVTFKGDLRIGGSRGKTQGRVGFHDGFRIEFSTPEAAFADVEDLAGLSFKGVTSIEGETSGDSDSATFDMKLKTRDFVFENYVLGEVAGHLRYRRGHLLLQELTQSLGRTRTHGSMDIDLRSDRIAGEFSADPLEAADLVEVFAGLWRFPLDVQAAGRARMEFDGPLNFWKLNYDLNADLRNGRLQGDSFDSFTLGVKSINGDMRLEKAEVRKNASIARASGGIGSDRVVDVLVDVNNVRLEESEFVTRIRSNVAGQVNLTAQIKGPVTGPDVHVKGSIAEISVDERDIPGSYFDLHRNSDRLAIETTLFGNRIQGDLSIPLKTGSAPLRLRVKTIDWPFTGLLSLIGASALQNEYESNLTADIDLRSDAGRFDRMSGKVQVRTLSIERGAAVLRNQGPIEATLEDGRITLKNSVLEGTGGGSIRLRGEDFLLDRLGIAVQADTDLRLLHLFAPFLDDLGGRLKVEASIAGSLFKPEILGNASMQNAFIKLKGFPHPIEKLQADMLFSQTRVLIQGIRGQLGGGNVEGEGSILLRGFGDIPVNVRLRARGLSLNVPDKVHSNGDADLQFSGRWFPFVLSGTYEVSSALFEKELAGDTGLGGGVRTSSYLPKILRQAQFDPVLLDLDVNLPRNVIVKNSLMDGSVTGRLQVKGPPGNPILLGRIQTEKDTKVIFKDKIFDVVTGTFTFDNPEQVNPELYISAQTRLDQYDINVLVQGLAKDYSVRMTSVPPLPEQDIISLLALGITSSTLDGTVSSVEQEKQLGYEALGLGFSRTGGNKLIERATGFNVSISSTYDQTKNISVPKVTFTRKLSDRLNATYARPLNGESGAQEFKLQYQLNTNVSAIGSYEERDNQDSTALSDSGQGKRSIFGLDLEFKREFK